MSNLTIKPTENVSCPFITTPSPLVINKNKNSSFNYNGKPIPEIFTWCECHLKYHKNNIPFKKWRCKCLVGRLYNLQFNCNNNSLR